MTGILVAALMVAGALFMLVAALGIVRMPDVYMRMSCNAKGVTMGLGMLLLAFVLHFQEVGVGSRALATMVFVILTVPVASHRIGRSAYLAGSPLWEKTTVDEWGGEAEKEREEADGQG